MRRLYNKFKYLLIPGIAVLALLLIRYIFDPSIQAKKALDEFHSLTQIVVHDLNPKSTVSKDSIIDTTFYIPLETTRSSLIGQIDELIITEKYIVVLDIYQTSSIYIFDRMGSFLQKINQIGEGPGEYTQPTDIVMDEENDQILLLHGFPSKVMKYNTEGDFIEEMALPMRFRSFSLLMDGSIVLVNEPGARKYGNPQGHFNEIFSKLVILNPSGNTIYAGGPINRAYEENIISNINFGIIENQGLVSFQPCFSDTIFRVVNYQVNPQFIFDFKEHKVIEKEVAGKTSDEYKEVGRLNDYYRIYGRHSQTDQFLVVTVHAMKQNLLHLVYYNKYNGATMLFHKMHSLNPLNTAIPIPTIAYKDYFVSIIGPIEFIEAREAMGNVKEGEVDADLLRFAPTQHQLEMVDENSNPILCFFKLRPEKINMESVFYE